VDVPDLAELDRARGLALGVVAKVEAGGGDKAGAGRESDELGRLRRGQRERLLADDVLAGLQGRACLRR
jgi:hypothetical protein